MKQCNNKKQRDEHIWNNEIDNAQGLDKVWTPRGGGKGGGGAKGRRGDGGSDQRNARYRA